MDKRTTGIIATIVTILLCGCPGLFALCFGALTAMAGFVPGADIDILGSSDPQAALTTGIGTLCLGLLFVAIPIVVGIVTLRNRRPPASLPGNNEPLPPAI